MMVGVEHMIDRPRMRQAVRMLAGAIEPIATVEWSADPEAASSALIRLRGSASDPLVLHFEPWPGEGGAGDDVVWVIRRGTAALRKRLREAGRNYVDLSGAVRLAAGPLLVDRTDLEPARMPRAARMVDPFSDRNSLVVRTLLSAPGREWKVREIAAAAGVALGTASEVVSRLGAMGVAELSRRTRTESVRVADPALLVRKWCERYAWSDNRVLAFHAPVGDPSRFLRRLPSALADRRWALTLQAGASLVAPHAAWERVHAYVDARGIDELYDVGADAGWEAGEDGGLVLMAPVYRHSVWHGAREIGGVPVVGTLQLVLDLWHYPLRGREQAEHLLAAAGLAG